MLKIEMLIALNSEIVTAHHSNCSVEVGGLRVLFGEVYGALAGLGKSRAVETPPEPAVSIRASVKGEHIVCLEDGKKLKMLKRSAI